MKNQKIRFALIQNNIRLYELADALKVSESTMTRKMRQEMSADEQEHIVSVIEGMKEKR